MICARTGLVIGSLNVIKVAGHAPYLRRWNDVQAFHPLFGLEFGALLNFSRSTWSYFCSMSQEQAANESFTNKQERLLQVASLALMYQIADIEQSIPWLPTINEVAHGWHSLLQLAGWKLHLDSQRFRFPSLRISKDNGGIELQAFLHDCWECKKGYETRVRESVELEKLKRGEAALIAIKNELAGKSPRSKKLLWRWFIAHMPSRYAADTEGWMWTIYDAETVEELRVKGKEFTLADIDLFEQIVLCEIPIGTSISHAFLERIAQRRKLLEEKFHTFEIIIPQMIADGVADGSITAEAPTLASCGGNRIKFLVAQAKWKLSQTKQPSAAIATLRQEKLTVKPSHIPKLEIGLDADEPDLELDDTTGLFIRPDDEQTGNTED